MKISKVSNHHGLLLVNKPSGITSHDVVAEVRKVFKTREIGHSGTLDPLASGLMVLLVGEATKLSSYITDGNKSYQVFIRLGYETDTLDITGKVLSEKKVECDVQEVIQQASQLSGELHLPIPLYSAKKIDGKKLYEYARENTEIETPYKNMTFWDIQNRCDENQISFHLRCSKGSFIRSWVQELGKRLGCGAVMSGLIRTSSHHFSLDEAVELEALKQAEHPELYLRPMVDSLSDFKKIKIKGQDLKLLKNGQISHDLRSRLIILCNPETDRLIQIQSVDHLLIALISLEPGKGFQIKRVFN